MKDDEGNQIYHLPDYPIESGETTDEYFARMSREGLEKRFQGPHFKKLITLDNWDRELKPKYYERLEEEVKMICDMGFPGYFLIVGDFIQWSKEMLFPRPR